MIKKGIIVLVALITLQGCSQTKNNKEMENIHTKISKGTNEKIIFLSLNYFSCSIEVLIDDVLVYSDLNGKIKSGNSNTFQINEYLLKSGIQQIKVILFPVSDKNDVLETQISNIAKASAKIIYGSKNSKINTYTNLIDISIESSLVSNKPYYEISKSFEIKDLPYTITGWSQSVILEKENKNDLLKETLEYYDDYILDFKMKDIQSLSLKVYQREFEKSVANYFNNEEDSKKILESLTREVNTNQNFLPISNYELRFYGNGKIVTLRKIDNKFRGESVIIGETDEDYNFYPIYLHRPKAGAPLEVIR